MQTELNMPSGKSKFELQRVQQGIYMSSSTVYETSKKAVEPDWNATTSSTLWQRWGTDNNYPQTLIDTVMGDPAATLLEKRRAMHYGRGLMFHRKKYDAKGNEQIEFVPDDQVPAEILDFMWQNDWPNFQQGIIADFEWWTAYYVLYIPNANGKIVEAKWQRVKDVRAEKKNPSTGRIENYFLSGMWPKPQENQYIPVPAFDRIKGGYGLYKHQLVSIDKDYYPQPGWHGVARWLSIAGKIPRWILANIDNSINIKYHVKIPLEYFMKRHPIEMYKTSEDRNAAIVKDEQDLYRKIDSYLAGESNVNKAFYSKVAIDDNGKPLPGWEILPLDNPINHDAWLQAYGTAQMAIASGMGLSPSLSGAILPNGLGGGSGSDLREQFNFYMQVMTAQPRQTTLEPFEIIKRINKWDPTLYLGYRDVVLQSMDQNKGGFAVQNEQSPTNNSAPPAATQPANPN